MDQPDPTHIRELIADSQAEFLLQAEGQAGQEAAGRLRALRESRKEAVKRIAEEKGYNAPVTAVTEQLDLLRTILGGRGTDWTTAPGYMRLAAKLKEAKRDRLAALHEDEDVRRVFNEYFDSERPIKEACSNGGAQ